ncbi:MAG: BamA/TamA family outer membrane protein [Candidatus Omnitrophica bacterium]|nr:BamA/TamA family outer membrane protein [Candidatus Omnitrophota bacterium]
MIAKRNIFLFFFFFVVLNIPICICRQSFFIFAQEVGEIEKIEKELEKEKILRERLEKEKKAPEIEEKKEEVALPKEKEERVFIRKINVVGATLLSEKEIEEIIKDFKDKELSLKELQKICDLITDRYRQKGYVTSRAYLPPQKIVEGVLEIRVVEGLMGDLEVRGNRYFKSSIFKKKITLKKGEPFNYNILRKNLAKINEYPDRSCRAILSPGKEPLQTDILLEVKDKLPIHIGFGWDNFGSRYVQKDRYRTTITNNNFLGREDILTLQYQLAEADAYRLLSLRYLYPFTDTLKLGFFMAKTKLDLGREYKDLNARGKSKLYSIYLTQSLIEEENITLGLNLGFDYKDIFNFQLGEETSRDRLRVAKLGWDLDLTDKFGRTIITDELDFGIPDIVGGLKEKDQRASRTGSGGKFIKNTINLYRLQRMPFGTQLLWKNQFQFSSYTLTAPEQFQIGGISNVRGYPPAEHVGDRGFATTLECSFPPYFIPKNFKVPLSKAKLNDSLRTVIFYDWGHVNFKRPQVGEEKSETLSSAGFGFRFNLPEDFSLRLDFAWPLDKTPSDNDHLHTWIEVSKSF